MKSLPVLFLLSTFVCKVFAQDPQACYNFDYDGADQTINGFDGDVQGPVLVEGQGGTVAALSFNGSSDYIDITYPEFFTYTNWTYSAWIKMNALPVPSEAMNILSIGNYGGDQILATMNDYYGSTGFCVNSYGVGHVAKGVASGMLPVIGQWYFVTGVRSTDSISLYIDGKLIETKATGFSDVYYGPVQNRAAFVGQRVEYTASNVSFNGEIDDLKIFSVALNASEVKELYGHLGCECQSVNALPQACYGFQNNFGDNSGNYLDGKAKNVFFNPGRLGTGYAAHFNGKTSNVDITYEQYFSNSEWTYSGWVNAASLPASSSAMIILSMGSDGSDQVLALSNGYYNATGFSTWTYGKSGSLKVVSEYKLPYINQWYFLTAVRSIDSLALYVDGKLISRKATGFNELEYGSGTKKAYIGQRSSVIPNTTNFKGEIQDVRIFKKALSAADIQILRSSCPCKAKDGRGVPEWGAKENEIQLFPNPSSGQFAIQNNSGVTLDRVVVYDVVGREVYSNFISENNASFVDLSSFSKGVYLVNCMDEEGNLLATKKVVLQ